MSSGCFSGEASVVSAGSMHVDFALQMDRQNMEKLLVEKAREVFEEMPLRRNVVCGLQ